VRDPVDTTTGDETLAWINRERAEAFRAGAIAMMRAVSAWLRAQTNAEHSLNPSGPARAAFVEAHNAVLKMPLPEFSEHQEPHHAD
jgi:hypothetical protein